MSENTTMVYDVDSGKKEEVYDGPAPEEKAIVVADSLLPSVIPLIPLTDRPIFPKMMHPLVVVDERYKKIILDNMEGAPSYLGLVLVKADPGSPEELPKLPDNFNKVGVVSKILQVSTPEPKGMVHVMVQALEGFEIIEILSEEPPFNAKVKSVCPTAAAMVVAVPVLPIWCRARCSIMARRRRSRTWAKASACPARESPPAI